MVKKLLRVLYNWPLIFSDIHIINSFDTLLARSKRITAGRDLSARLIGNQDFSILQSVLKIKGNLSIQNAKSRPSGKILQFV